MKLFYISILITRLKFSTESVKGHLSKNTSSIIIWIIIGKQKQKAKVEIRRFILRYQPF